MSHQDRTSPIVVNHQTIKQAADWLLPPAIFGSMKTRSNASWKPRMLAVAALLWATSGLPNLVERFAQARKIVHKIFRWQLPPGTTYQGFMKMLRKWHGALLLAIVPEIRVKMREALPGQWKIAGYVVFAGDGSRIELARTASLEEAFSPKRKKEKKKQQQRKGKRAHRRAKRAAARKKSARKQSSAAVAKKENSPQMWLTLLWHVGTGLPWAWRTGPSDSSERGHLLEMLAELPEHSLITADAGFVGYDFWSAILRAGHHFVIRVGANVGLLKNLGYARQHEHTVYLWPDAAAKKQQPPLVLRLIVIHNGRHPVYLVTNLTKAQLSDQQAARIYGARWGIELFFRTFKQTFGCRKLRSHTAANAKLEVDWSLLGLWCVCLLGQRELAENREDPTWLSAAATIKAFQSTLREYRVRPETREESLWAQLRVAVLDDYRRASSKTSRNYPRKKNRQGIGAPRITRASKQQINAAAELKQQQPEFRLPA
ncbi:MAG: IS4 family transposase [Planctomycetota bacterium]